MANRTIGFRCPQELVQVIESRAMATGRSPTQVMIEILTQALLPPCSSAPEAATPKLLQRRLFELQSQIETVARHLAESKGSASDTTLVAYVEFMEKAAKDLQKSLSQL